MQLPDLIRIQSQLFHIFPLYDKTSSSYKNDKHMLRFVDRLVLKYIFLHTEGDETLGLDMLKLSLFFAEPDSEPSSSPALEPSSSS